MQNSVLRLLHICHACSIPSQTDCAPNSYQVRMQSSRAAQDDPTSTSAEVNEKQGGNIISSRQKSLGILCIQEAYEFKIICEYNATFNTKLHVCFLYTLQLLLLIRELCTSIENKGAVDNSIGGRPHVKHLEKPKPFSCYFDWNICRNRQFS